MHGKRYLAPLYQKAKNRATTTGIQGNCQMENRSVKLQEYWNVGVMGKWVGRLPCSSNWLISEFVNKGDFG
jgi:hypothetical protein